MCLQTRSFLLRGWASEAGVVILLDVSGQIRQNKYITAGKDYGQSLQGVDMLQNKPIQCLYPNFCFYTFLWLKPRVSQITKTGLCPILYSRALRLL